jgi:hypothetical protein
MPPVSGGFGGEPMPAVARPGTVSAAVVCWLLAGLTLIIAGALTMAAAGTREAKDALVELFAESQVQISDAVVEQVLLGTGVACIVLGSLMVAFGFPLLSGANWARILLTVLGVLGVLLVLFPVVFVALAIVLQFLPASNAWLRARAAQRAGRLP